MILNMNQLIFFGKRGISPLHHQSDFLQCLEERDNCDTMNIVLMKIGYPHV